MLGRAILFVVGIAALGVALIWFGVLQNPLGLQTSSKPSGDELSFRLSRDKYGEHTELTANVRVSFVSSINLPDRIDISSKDGTYYGSVVWTALQTERGESRLKGEVRTGGRSYRVCEFLSRAGVGASTTAERFYPMNNDGIRFRNPDNIDPSPLQALLTGIVAEQSALGTADAPLAAQVAASAALNRNAMRATAMCFAPPGATQR